MLFKITKALAETLYCPDGSVMDPALGCIDVPGGVINPSSSLFDLILRSADILLLSVGSLSIIILMRAGLQYSLAMGDDDQIRQAKVSAKWSIIGLVLSLSAYFIVDFLTKQVI